MEQRPRWRSNLPAKYSDILKLSQIMTLFLVHSEPAIGEFVFADPLQNQYRVNIGNTVSCSCLPGYGDHCIHTFYVMLRILKLTPDNPLVWQQYYTRQQLKSILHTDQGTGVPSHEDRPMLRSRLYTRGSPISPKKEQTEQPTIDIQPDSVCAICHEPLLNGTALTSCRSSCHNSFHIECVKVWLNHKRISNGQLSCPMCRCTWQERFMEDMKQDEYRFIKQHSFGRLCFSCKRDIPMKLYKCLFCKQVELCHKCYTSWKHAEHDKWMCKVHFTKKWSVAETRSQFDYASYKNVMEVIKQHDRQSLNAELLTQDLISALNKEKQPPTQNNLEYLVSCFPSVEKDIYKLYKKIDFGQQDIKCIMCRRTTITGMRRLYCKHFIDEKCLRHLLDFKIVNCPIDNTTMLLGYSQILQDVRNEEAKVIEGPKPHDQSNKNERTISKETEARSKQTVIKPIQAEIHTPSKVIRGRGVSVREANKRTDTNFQDLVIDTRIRKRLPHKIT